MGTPHPSPSHHIFIAIGIGFVNSTLYTGDIEFIDIPAGMDTYWVQRISGQCLVLFRSLHLNLNTQPSLFKGPQLTLALRIPLPSLLLIRVLHLSEGLQTVLRLFMRRFLVLRQGRAILMGITRIVSVSILLRQSRS